MNRATLRPVRTRRFSHARSSAKSTTPPETSLPVVNASTRKTLGALGALWLAFATAHATPSSPAPAPAAGKAVAAASVDTATLLGRGRYLVENVGMCADCHSPRNEKGEYLRELWLMGSPLPFQPMIPMPWSAAAPSIAGLPTMTNAQAIKFLTTGQRPDGSRARPPMPEFRLTPEDAHAVVAYLKSFNSQATAK